MNQNNDQFIPIKLPEVHFAPRITSPGYYAVGIKDVWEKQNKDERTLSEKFEVIAGKSKGTWIRRKFDLTEGGLTPLAYMCRAVGISDELENPQLLISKKLTVLVILNKSKNTGIIFPEIKLFFPLQSQPSSEKWEVHGKI